MALPAASGAAPAAVAPPAPQTTKSCIRSLPWHRTPCRPLLRCRHQNQRLTLWPQQENVLRLLPVQASDSRNAPCRLAPCVVSPRFSCLEPKPLLCIPGSLTRGFCPSLSSSALSLPPRRFSSAAYDVSYARGGVSGTGLKFGVVVALFNDIVTRALLAGALETFERHGVASEDIQVVQVPGSFEIPLVAQKLAKSGNFHAILCLGAVVRGSTTHYDAVANSAASGVLNASLASGVPCVFGVLTCETMEQAMDRAGGKLGNKGAEAAVTAIEMADLIRSL